MFQLFGEVFNKKLKKLAPFVKKHKKSSIWPDLAFFRENYHVSAFLSGFDQKVAKGGSFREKVGKIMDLAKTCNFSRKLPCFGVLVNFSAKSCKKWLLASKSTKNDIYGQNLQLFEETIMFRPFGELFDKKWVISWKSTKNHPFGEN